MATKFVFSGAAGLNDGSSWANAWTSLASSTGVAAGDIVKVHKTHDNASLAAIQTWGNGTLSNPVRIICVDKDNGDAESTGGRITWTASANIIGNLFVKGLTIRGDGASLNLAPPADGMQQWENCSFVQINNPGVSFSPSTGSGGARKLVRLLNCDVDLSGTTSTPAIIIASLNDGAIEWYGGTVTLRNPQTNLFNISGSGFANVRIAGVVFNGTVTNLILGAATVMLNLDVIGCKAPTYSAIWSTPPTGMVGRVNLQGFQSANLSTALLQPSQLWQVNGTTAADVSRYRTGGAWDKSQANPYSWQLASSSSAASLVSPMQSAPLTSWVTAGSRTLTIYIASGVSLNNDECWADVISPSEAVSPTAQSRYQNSRCGPLATPTALATDISTWNGSGVGVKQKITFSIAPTIPGPVVVRVYLAKALTTIYVDPVMDVS